MAQAPGPTDLHEIAGKLAMSLVAVLTGAAGMLWKDLQRRRRDEARTGKPPSTAESRTDETWAQSQQIRADLREELKETRVREDALRVELVQTLEKLTTYKVKIVARAARHNALVIELRERHPEEYGDLPLWPEENGNGNGKQ